MHAHRIDVFNRTDDDAVVRLVAHNLHLVFFPTDQALVDQDLANGRGVDARPHNLLELIAIVSDAAAGAAHREGWPDHHRKTNRLDRAHRLDEAFGAIIVRDLAVGTAYRRRRRNHGARAL